ncbi:MAG: response regulator [Treponema sp.]|nr:response regulator [Treponema sp.]
MKKPKDFIYHYVFSDEYPLNQRILNMIGMVGLCAVGITAVGRYLIGFGAFMSLVMLGMLIVLGLLLYMGNRYRMSWPTVWGLLIFLGDILFPITFFLIGGANGGMSAFFVMSMVCVFMICRGRVLIVLLGLHIAVIAACYYAGYHNPALLGALTPVQQLFDGILSIMVGGFFIGTVVKFQNKIYYLEEQKVADAGKELVRQDKMLHAVNDTAEILLTADAENFEKVLQQSMGILAHCVDVDHVCIWKNFIRENKFGCTRIYLWDDEGRNGVESSVLMEFMYNETLPLWEERLSGGKSISGPIRNFQAEEQEVLKPYGMISILVIPVFLQDQFWGFISFDDCHNDREFPPVEESIMRSGSLLMVNAIARNEMTHSLIQAREEALSSARAKSDFLANMSHEMRTPMNAITGMTAIAKGTPDAERKDYCLNKIEDASTHLLGVINDILDMSKIEANKFELSIERFNFEKMLQKTVNVVNFRVEERQQKFYVNFDKRIPHYLIGDDQRLAQVITNLLSNAVKFTPEQGTIRLEAQMLNEEGSFITIQFKVIDSGIGISAEQQSRLFHYFEQAESGTSRKFGGTGLGLTISKRIVEMMGGKIWIESELGEGATFAFTVQVERGASGEESRLSPGVNWSNIRILAVDDALETRTYFKNIAEQFGIFCDTAEGGEQALELINTKGGYNIYFVDWKMPGMDGVELSRRIKEKESRTAEVQSLFPPNSAKLPLTKSVVIMISAAEWTVIEKEAKEAGVDKFLSKPLFPSAIADCINECLGVDNLRAAEETDAKQVDKFEGSCILLVEDVEINQEIILALLEPTLLEIDCAANGVQAVEMFNAAPEKYDAIFMDVQMPKMDGYEATRKIREFEAARAQEKAMEKAMEFGQATEGCKTPKQLSEPVKPVPIIAMTANVFREDVEKCIAAGMNDHVGKPLDFDDVFTKLRMYLRKTN